MYGKLDQGVSFAEMDRRITAYWKENRVFEKSLALWRDEMVFYDGPPFPTGSPHHGTIFVSVLKDALARYFTMTGHSVPRRWGWDCHGLPVEKAVEQRLGVTNKKQIEQEIGVARFNRECRALVSGHNEAWREYVERIGRWVDYENAYRTMDRDYMESVIWAFAESHRRGSIYRDYRVTPYCYRCETSLSISDTRESDSTRLRRDPAVTVKLRADLARGGRPTYFLVWTTTPWTLPANLALAVNPRTPYLTVEAGDEAWILAQNARGRVAMPQNSMVLGHHSGADLVGWRYEPPFPYYRQEAAQGAFRVLAADHVNPDEGTGVVHIAPAFGEDDYWLCRANAIDVRNPVDEGGRFTSEVPDHAGRNVHDANPQIVRVLRERGMLVHATTIEHNYPHCWRCRTPLIYRAMQAWYFDVQSIRDRLLRHNERINWVPRAVRRGRFGKWLEGARDWNISRNRYWGTPIPVWECNQCSATWVASSASEIEARAGTALPDLHKEHLDAVRFPCERPGCGGRLARVPEVLDGWFESGAMPFAQCHYPFQNREWFESHFPADFIVEYTGQIRCWFYYLHVLSVALMDRPAFRSCLVHGTLLSADGTKLSKSLRNYTDPMALLDRHGADALRLYLMGSAAACMVDLRFRDEDVQAQVRDVLLPVWNAVSFFCTYADIDGYAGDGHRVPAPGSEMDRWILARLCTACEEVGGAYAAFRTDRAVRALRKLVGDLTNWYIRRSRQRFWATGLDDAKRTAYDTLHYCLICLARIMAPAAPFVAEEIHLRLTGGESVHLAPWPQIPGRFADARILSEVALVQRVAALGHSLRKRLGIKVRQPLARLLLYLPDGAGLGDSPGSVLCDELNVKSIHTVARPEEIGTLRAFPDARKLGPRLGAEVQELIRAAKAGRVRVAGARVIVTGSRQEWSLRPEEVSLSYTGRQGVDVAADEGMLVALDATITPELREEGVANEIAREVQGLRKSAGYDIADRILLEIQGPLSARWRKAVADAALAAETRIGAPDAEAELQIEGRTFHLRVARAPQASTCPAPP